MPATTADVLVELNTLMRLTAVEADVARSRRVQARDEDVRRELTENARNAERRRAMLQQEIQDLGGAPDLIGLAVDRVVTLARTQVVDQAMPVHQALLGDLALEHQLRERAAFARVLAEACDLTHTVRLLEGVEEAHAAAIDWVETRLAEVAMGGPGALAPTPLQTVARIGQRAATLPSRTAVAGVNRTLTAAGRVADRIGGGVDRTKEFAEAAEESLTAGPDAFLRTSEEQAGGRGATGTARALHRVRAEAGSLSAEELPVRNYDGLNAAQASRRIQQLDDAGDVRAVLAYEAANRNRSSVASAVERRMEELAGRALSR